MKSWCAAAIDRIAAVPQRMMDILVDTDASAAEVHTMTEASPEWTTATSDKILELLQSRVKKIVVDD